MLRFDDGAGHGPTVSVEVEYRGPHGSGRLFAVLDGDGALLTQVQF